MLQLAEMIHVSPMFSSLLLRLAMVALTMAAVCWIGWTASPSEDLQAEADRVSSVPAGLEPPLASSESTAAPPVMTQPGQRRGERPAGTRAVDLNHARQQEFERLPGIGPVLAGRIVAYRKTQGPFLDVEQLRRVKGIGKKTLERIRPHVAVMAPAVSRAVRDAA